MDDMKTNIEANVETNINIKGAKSIGNTVKDLESILARLEEIKKVAKEVTKEIDTLYGVRRKSRNSKSSNSSTTASGGTSTDTEDKQIKEEKKKQVAAEKTKTKATQESAKNAKEEASSTKQKRRTASPEAKLKHSEKLYHTWAYNERTNVYDKEYNLREKRFNETAEYRKYREKHPELFATGGREYSWKHQMQKAGMHVAGTAISKGGAGAVIGNAAQIALGFVKTPAVAAATAIMKFGDSIVNLADDTVKAYQEIESVKTQLGVVMPTQSQANSLFSDISQYAVKSPFGVQETSELAILLKQSGVYATDLMSTLRMLGDTAGGNMEKMQRIANNYAQIVSTGKASMLDMRQFAYAGIPIFEAVSKELGVSQSRLRELISDGKVSADIIEKVFKNLTGVNGVFENATEQGAKTLKARLQNLADSKQLRDAGLGQLIVNTGSKYGNDSYVTKVVTLLESINESVKDFADNKNQKQDEKNIKNREKRIKELSDLIPKAEKGGYTEYAKKLKKELEELSSQRFIEQDRSVFSTRYKNFIDKYSETLQNLGYNTDELFNSAYKIAPSQFDETKSDLATRLYKYLEIISGSPRHDIISENTTFVEAEYNEIQTLYNQLNSFTKELKKISDKHIDAYKEVLAEEYQSTGFDSAIKSAKGENSSYSLFQKLSEIYENSDKTKQEREDKQKELLKTAQTLLKKLSNYTDKTGNLDFTSLSMNDFLSYKQNDKAFIPTRKLSVTGGTEQSKVDAPILANQYITTRDRILRELTDRGLPIPVLQGGNLSDSYSVDSSGKITSVDEKKFYKGFGKQFASLNKSLENLAKSDSKNADVYKKLQDYLQSSTMSWEVPLNGLNADLNETSGSGKALIPLWKRIISQYTGISANAINSSKGALNVYDKEVVSRNYVTQMMSGMLKSGYSVNDILKNVSLSGERRKLQGDDSYTWQVDFVKTAKNFKEMSKEFSLTTNYAKIYADTLQAEYDTLSNLFVSSLTETESQNITTANWKKTVDAKDFGTLTDDTGEQFVNAFGEKLLNADGQVVASIKKGVAYDKEGNKLQNQQIELTGNLFEWLKQNLPKLKENVTTAKDKAAKDTITGERADKLINAYASNAVKSAELFAKTPTEIEIIKDSSETLKSYITEYIKENQKDLENFDKIGFRKKSKELVSNTTSPSKTLERNIKDEVALSSDLDFINNIREREGWGKFSKKNKDGKKKGKGFVGGFLDFWAGDTPYKLLGQETKDLSAINYNAINGEERIKNYNTINEQIKNLKKNKTGNTVDTGSLVGIATDDQLAKLNDANTSYKERLAILKEIRGENDLITEGTIRQEIGNKACLETLTQASEQLKSVVKETTKKAFVSTFETLGESLVTSEDASDELAENIEKFGAELLKNTSEIMVQTGLQIAGAGATSKNWGMVAAGLGLAALGGVASGISSALLEDDDNEEDDESSKLESLADKLADLLNQAKVDAEYYEKTLRHKTALGINSSYTNKTTSVSDAVITPSGKVISTAPDDYLIATKTPETLYNNQTTVQPKVNVIINKNSSKADVRVEENINADGTLELVATVEDIISNYISSPRSDDAFNARSIRQVGRKAVM